jgi:hypothetical protein
MDTQATSSFSFPQADPAPFPPPSRSPAHAMLPSQRQRLAVQVLGRAYPLADLARRHQVSRKFLYRQAELASHALTQAFHPKPAQQKVLFYLPVTKAWLRQFVLALVLIGHSPYRAVVVLLRDLFDWHISPGTVHRIVSAAVEPARAITGRYDLGGVRIGAHDEIFQAGSPVLVGVDTASSYCYLLCREDHRDAETWGVRLLELADRGFAPQATIADAGNGLRAGQALALPEVPCRGDVFHILRELELVGGFLEDRGYRALEQVECRGRERESVRRHDGRGRRGHGPVRSSLSAAQRLRRAHADAAAAVALADDVALLLGWLRRDILAVAGPGRAGPRRAADALRFRGGRAEAPRPAMRPSAGADRSAVGETAG